MDYGYPDGKKNKNAKPSLYKSGAEKMTQLFNLIVDFQELEAVEAKEHVFYKFRCEIKTRSGQLVGVGYGSGSSNEKKHWSANPLGNANTILKMAKKRSHVDAVLTGLGASNVFTQDVEDYEPEQINNTSQDDASEKQIKFLYTLLSRFAIQRKMKPRQAEEAFEKVIGKPIKSLNKEEASYALTFLGLVNINNNKEIFSTVQKYITEYGFWKVMEKIAEDIEMVIKKKTTIGEFLDNVSKKLSPVQEALIDETQIDMPEDDNIPF